MVLARWGGMGHHRYQVGFSGDVAALTWDNLAYQPYFSATAANVLFPSWSHDIEGTATFIILGHFGPFLTRFQAPHHPARAVCCGLLGAYAHRVLIGACNPML